MGAVHAGAKSKPSQSRRGKASERRLTNAQLWQDTWSSARIHLRLTDRQFGAITPRQFYQLLDRHRETVNLQKSLFGIVAAAVANFSGHASKHLHASDFTGKTGDEKPKRQTYKDKVARMRGFLSSQVSK
jgi:hypothetical protein